MAKRLNLATRAFGAEPVLPDVVSLADWIAGHRGTAADITTCLLDQSLIPQLDAGIMIPCAGGIFYADRIRQSIRGISDNKAVGELHVDSSAISEDGAGIFLQRKGAWCAMPAPHYLAISDTYYDDAGEWTDAICGAYRTIMRSMRDSGVSGHILICRTIDGAELAALAGGKVLFFQPEPNRENLAGILEHQQQIAVGKNHLEAVFDLTKEYSLRKIFIIDPDPESIDLALSYLDPDQVVAGGYCRENCGVYWKMVAASAVYWQ
jgi:hypothetical protein